MTKFFYIADRKSSKYIVKANVDNKLFKDNCVIIHAYPNKDGFLIYLHENALALADKSMSDNKRFIEKAKNEHFAKRFTLKVDRTKCKTADEKQKADVKTLNEYLAKLEVKASEIKKKADEKQKAETSKTKANKTKTESKKADVEKQPA